MAPDQVRLVATAIRVQALARLMLLAGPGAKAVVVARRLANSRPEASGSELHVSDVGWHQG